MEEDCAASWSSTASTIGNDADRGRAEVRQRRWPVDLTARGSVLSAYLIINLTVVTVGQMMVILAPPERFTLFAIVAILVCLAAVPVSLSTAAAPVPLETVRLRIRHLVNVSPVAFFGCLYCEFATW
jgi:hypothetical protein